LNDIMFFLLLFFLITSTLATPSVLKLLLPNARTGVQVVKHPVVISVSGDLQYAINSKVVPYDRLEEELKIAIAGQADPAALLKVDQAVQWQQVVDLLDIGNRNKIKMVAATNITKKK
jgi:biopolymer transport protein ExbD